MATVEQDASMIAVDNPATGQLVGAVPVQAADEIAAMAVRAREAQKLWEQIGFGGRAAVMLRAERWMAENAERVIKTVCSETGKTYEDAQLTDWGYTMAALGFWAKHAEQYLGDEKVPSWKNPVTAGRKLRIRHVPVGLVGVIGPWNFPLVNGFGDTIPAMMAGNAVILKPSEVTPLSSQMMLEALTECGLPEGVLQVATGDGSTGGALIDQVDMIMFTGSTRTGRIVAKAAAERLIPCSLELGGNDPMIVLADADLERASSAAAYYSMNNAGQVCISIERAYVEEPIYDAFVERVTEKVKALRQGQSTGPGQAEVGAVIFAPQLGIVEAHVQDALAKGAKVMTGGHAKNGAGRFFEPTVLVDVDHSMKMMTEETFGPTLPIMKISDAEQGVVLANDSQYGLQASVWTKDADRGEQLARRLQAGAVSVNDHQLNYTVMNLPMGGWKSSGIGTRHGAGGIRKYCRTQSLLITGLALRKEMFWFPYKPAMTRALQRYYKLMYRGKKD